MLCVAENHTRNRDDVTDSMSSGIVDTHTN